MTITFERYTAGNDLVASISQYTFSRLYRLEISEVLDDSRATTIHCANYQTIASAKRAMKRFGKTWTLKYKFGRETKK